MKSPKPYGAGLHDFTIESLEKFIDEEKDYNGHLSVKVINSMEKRIKECMAEANINKQE